jgi:hypothetical protein
VNLTKLKSGAQSLFLEGWTSYVTIAVSLIVFMALLSVLTGYIIKYTAYKMTGAHFIKEKSYAACGHVQSAERLAFVNGQRNEIRELGNQHHENAIRYFSFFYSTYLVVTVFGLIAAICLAIITKTGLEKASAHLITVFLISTAIVILYQGSFDVLKQKANIDLNGTASIKYAMLADQMDTYCTTGKLSMKDPNDVQLAALPKATSISGSDNANTPPNSTAAQNPIRVLPFFVEPDADQFINYIAWQMEHMRSFAITVDDTKVGSIDKTRFSF